MRGKRFTYDEAEHLALEVFPRIARRTPITETLAQVAKEEGYAEGSFRRRFYAWDKAMMDHPSDGGVAAVFKPSQRTTPFTKALSLPLQSQHRSCYAVYSFESFVAAYDYRNHYMVRCKKSKLRRLYELYKFLSDHPTVFHWDTITKTVRACINDYKHVKPNVIADDLFTLYEIGVLIIDPPLRSITE